MTDVVLYEDLGLLDEDFDAAVLRTPGAATYCTSRDWIVAADSWLHPELRPVVMGTGDHWAAFSRGTHAQVGPYLQPLEADWGFASPLIGPDAGVLLDLLTEVFEHCEDEWNVALLSGLPRSLAQFVASHLGPAYRAIERPGISCQIAWLDDGMDGFMSRRSPLFRRNLRRDRRRIERDGITFDLMPHDSDATEVLQRALGVEQRSWKWTAGQSVLANRRYRNFYEAVLRRAAARGSLWALFAHQGTRDIAYIFGGVLDDTYRGFQLGFDQTYSHLGLGNQAQLALIEALIAAGVARYDLGMEMDYKRRWSDELLDLTTIVVLAV